MSTLTPDAVSKLREVKQHILDEPERLAMHDWVNKRSEGDALLDALDGWSIRDGVVELNPPCGTAACIGGWLCVLNNLPYREDWPDLLAANLLGINPLQAEELFKTPYWPEDLRKKFTTISKRVRAQAAAEVIDRFIERYS